MVEGGGLENRFPVAPGRGFESLLLRHHSAGCKPWSAPADLLPARAEATSDLEPRERKILFAHFLEG